MSRRITLTTVKNFAIALGIIGTPVGIVLFQLLFAQGLLVVNDYDANKYCGDDHPCWIELDVNATTDIFIYPMDGTDLVNARPSDSINEYHLYRSWGSGWREINLSKPCAGTWCGGKSNYENKFVFAFREGKRYKLRIEIFKDWDSTINWSINPKGVFPSVELAYDLVNYTKPIFEEKTIIVDPVYIKENDTWSEEIVYIEKKVIGYETLTEKVVTEDGFNIDGINYRPSILQELPNGEYEMYEYFTTNPSIYCKTCRCRPYEIEQGICAVIS